ncbi:MAG: hypothetical protein K9L85_00345 [Candidatus Peribacteraceae bacterium]|nr:hypothetical protein [Candidatus Peribacteraceae bacterium]
MNPKIVFGIVLFGTKYLAESLPSLIRQNYQNCGFYLLDQEEDVWSGADFVEQNLPEIARDPRVKIERGQNLWHSGGHNKLIRQALESGADYYVAASNDMLYPADLSIQAISELEKPVNQEFGSAAIKLRRWNFDSEKKTRILDSCGIGVRATHHFFDRGQGGVDGGQFDQDRQIFGASGALAIFRRTALESVSMNGEYFDELLHYKNDVELAYRLNWAGWKCLFLPQIIAYHDRQLDAQKRKNTRPWARASSLFGHLAVLEKHFSQSFSLKTKLATKLYNLSKLLFLLLTEPSTLKGFWQFREKRAELQKKAALTPRRVSAVEIEKLFE